MRGNATLCAVPRRAEALAVAETALSLCLGSDIQSFDRAQDDMGDGGRGEILCSFGLNSARSSRLSPASSSFSIAV